jgi:hypothetical protein
MPIAATLASGADVCATATIGIKASDKKHRTNACEDRAPERTERIPVERVFRSRLNAELEHWARVENRI